MTSDALPSKQGPKLPPAASDLNLARMAAAGDELAA